MSVARIVLMGLLIFPGWRAAAQEEVKRKDVGFTLGAGYVEGNDYKWVLGEFWRGKGYTLTKATSFLSLQGGTEFRVLFQLYFNPRLRWLISSTERVGDLGYNFGQIHTEYVSVVLPDLSIKYFLITAGNSYIYASCSFGGIMPFTGNPDLALTSSGIESGYGGGYQYVTVTYALGLEVQYTSIPVKVTSFDPENFGGWEITASVFF